VIVCVITISACAIAAQTLPVGVRLLLALEQSCVSRLAASPIVASLKGAASPRSGPDRSDDTASA